jgi:hypothetical protein
MTTKQLHALEVKAMADGVRLWLGSVDVSNAAERAEVIKALEAVAAGQTSAEFSQRQSREHNGRGFGKYDAQFGCELADKARRYGDLTYRQAAAVARMLMKYSRQIAEARIAELPPSVDESDDGFQTQGE